MPLAGHPDNCACCVKTSAAFGARGRKRTGEEADLSTFLPQQPPEEGQPEWEEEEEEQQEEEEEDALLSAHLFQAFDAHVAKLDAARLKRIEALSFKSALEDDGEGEVNEDASLDEIEGLGVWQPGDEFQGDVNYRTLQKLLTRVDQRGFERSAQQLEARPPLRLARRRLAHARVRRVQFHVAFMKAAARVIYRGSWETERPAIMKKHGWEKSNSEVLIRCVLLIHLPLLTPLRLPTATMGSCLCAQHPSPLRKDIFNRNLLRLPRARVRFGDRYAARCASSPLVRLLTHTLRAQSFSLRPGARPASYLRGSSSLCDWRVARNASASTTRRPAD